MFLESNQLLCPDDFMVAVPDGLVTVFLFTLPRPQTKGSLLECYRRLTPFFRNLFHAVLMNTSSISEQVRQSPEANSKSELAAFSLTHLGLTHHHCNQCCSYCCALKDSCRHPHHCHAPLVVFQAVLFCPVVCCTHC